MQKKHKDTSQRKNIRNQDPEILCFSNMDDEPSEISKHKPKSDFSIGSF